METVHSKIALGTCAWSFDDWAGPFYPSDLPANERLPFYARHLNAVELDSTFYHTPAAHIGRRWMEATPDDFTFVCKMSRAITHESRLRDCRERLHEFIEGIEPLRPRLGCVLIQLPPSFSLKDDESALRQFVMELPRGIRFAIEFRNHTWHMPRITRFLQENHVCLVWNDTSTVARSKEAPFDFLPITTDFLYLRLMGDLHAKYQGDGARTQRYNTLVWPRDGALDAWATKLRKHLDESPRLFVFANNHYEGFAPLTCQRFARRLGLDISLPAPEREEIEESDGQLELL